MEKLQQKGISRYHLFSITRRGVGEEKGYSTKECRAYEEIALRLSDLGNTKAALMVLDMDTFKNVNDSYGHFYGDKMLKAFAGRLKRSVRNSDIVARIGGDEFLLYVEYKGCIQKLADRIFHMVSGAYEGFEVSASIGIALAPENGVTYEELFICADQALYACKQAERNQWRVYDDSMKTILSSLSRQPEEEKEEDTV